MSRQQSRIVRELHDEPHIKGRRITVAFIKARVEGRGLAPQTVADRHELAVADVYRALAYYHDHPGEMREVERQRERAFDDHRHLTTDPDEVRE
jgi:uncharacterized protein (DUF433 family)